MTTDFYNKPIKIGSKVRWVGQARVRVVTEITNRGGLLFAGKNRKDFPSHCYVVVD